MLGNRRQQRVGVGHGGAHLVAAILQQPDQALPEHGGVLGDHHPQTAGGHGGRLMPAAAARP
jgi:hypothetical protein